MRPYPLTCFEFDNSPLALTQKTANEIIVIDLSQKTNALTVFATSTGQTGS